MKKDRISTILAITICCISSCCISSPVKVFASDEIVNPHNYSARMEQSGYLYKLMNGRQYKRLWSYTYARWLEPDWSLV